MFKHKLTVKLLVIIIITATIAFYSLFSPENAASGSLTSVTTTLDNPRFSFSGMALNATGQGYRQITLKTTGNPPDANTNNLFPDDVVTVGLNSGLTVSKIQSATIFETKNDLGTLVSSGNLIYSRQQAKITVTLTLASAIPSNGYVKVSIPSAGTNFADGIPDQTGWDAYNVKSSDISVSGGSGCIWGAKTFTASGKNHTAKAVNIGQCTGGTITMVIGTANEFINPAPSVNHIQGKADTYRFAVSTYDSSDNLIDTASTIAAPIDGVRVSATVPETISFTVGGVSKGASTCGQKTTSDSDAYSIPFGMLTTPISATMSQKLTVSTNAKTGYTVTLEKDKPLAAGGLGNAVIADTVCDAGNCTTAIPQEWKNGYNDFQSAFGYSLANLAGKDAVFQYNDNARVFNARPIDNQGNSKIIMMNNGPVSENQIYVCYMVALQTNQAAGNYHNNLTYTAIPSF